MLKLNNVITQFKPDYHLEIHLGSTIQLLTVRELINEYYELLDYQVIKYKIDAITDDFYINHIIYLSII